MNSAAFDLAAVIVAVGLLFAYYGFMRYKLRRDPYYTVHAVNCLARKRWVQTVMTRGQMDVLAIQTLRNSVMTASFMASTAILLMIGVLSLSGSINEDAPVWHTLNSGVTHPELLTFKLMLLLLDFFAAFFCFAMAVRFFNHVGYMINVPHAADEKTLAPGRVTEYLNRAGLCYVLGMRAFFFCVPLVFWLFGPHFMLLATIGLTAGQYWLDRSPR